MTPQEQRLVLAIRMWRTGRNSDDPLELRRLGEDLSNAATAFLQGLTPEASLPTS